MTAGSPTFHVVLPGMGSPYPRSLLCFRIPRLVLNQAIANGNNPVAWLNRGITMNSSIFQSKIFRRAALASIVALGAFGASNSFAAGAATASTATVIVPITITKSADLVFGRFASGAATGTVTVATNNARTATGGAILSTIGSTPTAAKFDVTGDNNATYDIIWSGDTTLSDGATTASTMALSRITALTASAGTTVADVASGTLSGAGAQSIYLGGVLDVGIAQTSGTYTGSVTATVEYN